VVIGEEAHHTLLINIIHALKQTAQKGGENGADGVEMERDTMLCWVSLKGQACWGNGKLLTPDWSLPDDLDVLLTEILLRAPTTSSPGLVVTASGKKIPVYPWGGPVDPLGGPFRRLTPPQRDVLVGLAINVLASNINDPEARRIAEIGGLDTIRLTVDRLLGELGKSGA
jgi:hypothetical protein